jgi:hypothetical protein
LSLSSQKNGFGIRDPTSRKNLFRIPDPGVRKAPDPGSGSATLGITNNTKQKGMVKKKFHDPVLLTELLNSWHLDIPNFLTKIPKKSLKPTGTRVTYSPKENGTE